MGDANQLVSEMYIHGSGTDVDLMAKSLRKRGLDNAQSTRDGTWGPLMATLQKGQPVPFGVTHCVGEIVKMNSNPSKYFAHKRPGDRYSDDFPGSGHWILVVGFEGTPENPTHFYTTIHIWVVKYEPPNLSSNEWALEMVSFSKSLSKLSRRHS